MMKNIMVLGATGRIGKLLLPLLTKQENKVTAYVRNPEKAVGSRVWEFTMKFLEKSVKCSMNFAERCLNTSRLLI